MMLGRDRKTPRMPGMPPPTGTMDRVSTRALELGFMIQGTEAAAVRRQVGAAAQNHSVRIVAKGLVGLMVACVALLCALVLAGSARADAGTPVVTEQQGSVPITTPGDTPELEKAGSPEPPPVKEVAPEPPPPVQEVATEPPPVKEVAPEPPPVKEVAPEPPPVQEVVPGPVVTEIVAEPLAVKEVVPPTKEPTERVTIGGGTGPKETASETMNTPNLKETGGTGPTGPSKDAAVQSPLAAAAAAPQAIATQEAAGSEGLLGGPGGTSASPPGAGGGASRAALAASQRAGCELSALGGPTTQNCSGGWLGAQRPASAPSVVFSSAAVALAGGAPTGGPPSDGGNGGSAVGRSPVSPTPSPAPGGVSGISGASAVGASGLALAGFLTLAGLLLLGAPRAMRRLRLLCQPWLTAFFVLIPERPG
jgi:outer membrane biosynthesis protein TonB